MSPELPWPPSCGAFGGCPYDVTVTPPCSVNDDAPNGLLHFHRLMFEHGHALLSAAMKYPVLGTVTPRAGVSVSASVPAALFPTSTNADAAAWPAYIWLLLYA